MKKRSFAIIALCVFCLAIFVGCGQQTPSNAALEFFISYLEVYKYDCAAALEMRHWEDAVAKELSQNTIDHITRYEILKTDQLSENLWAITYNVSSEKAPDTRTISNFVGLIDGTYYVMANPRQVPQDLKEGIDLSPYENDLYMYPSSD